MTKRILALVILAGAMVVPASAIPVLQLDIDNGTWVGGSEESTITTQNTFSLQALLTPSNGDTTADIAERLARKYYISFAVTPQIGVPGGDYGSFSIGSTTIDVTADMVYGTPPLVEMLDGNPVDHLSPHSIFSTYYYEHEFMFSGAQTPTYNVQDDSTPGGMSYIEQFAIDTSGLAAEVELHFDLYTYYHDTQGKKKIVAETDFAPYSHDAGTHRTTVPEGGATLGLFGLALVGLVGVRLCHLRIERAPVLARIGRN
jgi:hypothetical protein